MRPDEITHPISVELNDFIMEDWPITFDVEVHYTDSETPDIYVWFKSAQLGNATITREDAIRFFGQPLVTVWCDEAAAAYAEKGDY